MNHTPILDYSVIIPAYNEEAYLPDTLTHLKACMAALYHYGGEIIVADNNSTDRTAAIARQAGARVVFEKHRQIARSRNAGAKAARGRYLIFLDSDTQISITLLQKTLMILKLGECCGGGTLVAFDRTVPLFPQSALMLWRLLSRTFQWACGAYVFCTREGFRAINGFDERFYASEEIHFSNALRRWGRERGLRFEILNDPIITSSRKLDWHRSLEFWRFTLGLLLYHRPFENRQVCDKLWYRRPDDME